MKKRNEMIQRLYTLPEAAIYLGRSVYSVRELIWKGLLPVIQHTPRGKMWIDRVDIDRLIETEKRTFS
ncbi:MAG: helix-turn-helix domain-containing protein [Deltaproteobacteria bacterium]|nr:helix-turn-helix domain-containing protein [Deltaproteobacteria bacterium]